jgi:hypothetical protein
MANLSRYILRPIGACILLLLEILNVHFVYFVVNWYIFPRFGLLYQEKSGNPDDNTFRLTTWSQRECRANGQRQLRMGTSKSFPELNITSVIVAFGKSALL